MKSLDTPVLSQEIDYVAAFLAQDFDYKSFDIDELRGFLWAVAGSPIPLELDEWLSVIFNADASEQTPSNYNPFNSDEQKDTCLNIILRLYYQAIQQVIDEKFAWPTEYCIRDDGKENYKLSQWFKGFIYGYVWLEEAWDDCLQQIVDDFAQDKEGQELFRQQFKLLVFALTYLSVEAKDRQRFLDKFANTQGESISHYQMPTVQQIQKQLLGYGILGYEMRQRVEKVPQPIRVEKIGRNDPCLCGSGKKYKKCCGA